MRQCRALPYSRAKAPACTPKVLGVPIDPIGLTHKRPGSNRNFQIVLDDRLERRTVAYPDRRDELKQEAPKEQDTQDDDDCDDDDLH